MADKLSWNPPKWKSYTLNDEKFKVELETGEVYTGTSFINFIAMKGGQAEICYKIFGQSFSYGNDNELRELADVLNLNLISGYWPEYSDVKEFIERYYERVAKIGNSNISKIYIETEFDVTPKFTI